MPPNTLASLQALAERLERTGLTAEVKTPTASYHYLQVVNKSAPRIRNRITLRPYDGDNNALWFFHSWHQPIARAEDLDAAVADIQRTMQRRPGIYRESV